MGYKCKNKNTDIYNPSEKYYNISENRINNETNMSKIVETQP